MGRPGQVIRRLAGAVPPGAGAVVMAGGVVSLCIAPAGPLWVPRLLFAVAGSVWVALVVVFATRLRRWPAEAGSPPVLTMVAGTAVLGSRLTEAGRSG